MVAEAAPRERKPDWLRVRFPGGERYARLQALMREQGLHTVCEEARCPNIGECWNAGTATFMILGDVCTRSCGFCAVRTGRPGAVDPLEPYRLAKAVRELGLDYVVITSVNRDDVASGGAEVFAACIRTIHRQSPAVRVEVLIPDFKGNWDALAQVVAARPFVLNHNVETAPRLYREVRPQAIYERSLELIARAKALAPDMLTKSGFMAGLGETVDELFAVMRDLRAHGCDIVTVGQYLRPSQRHLPVARYYAPEEFAQFVAYGRELGFTHVEAGPLVRSSYHAERQSMPATVLAQSTTTAQADGRRGRAESPPRETPSRETPSRETPSRETPSRETPSRETPSRETPSRKTPSREATATAQAGSWRGRAERPARDGCEDLIQPREAGGDVIPLREVTRG